ncbi:MAG: hypothetical protein KJ556_11145 [Gammaproteobacteria bacterium]|nr:hypothetical protein [Gammaproteobacteria bacterium]MBU2056141.1 hypothetical protein [Gammaproteobacteria bacterium]MBU2175673.1 hypothetical protein [Gammaproteobacteria bacterium]MBU2245380.1 hypothetical protein [Gammaproteobacteria bacterium]MBU2345771.1 hypothetical protein [Gammaproteobacteria bacterium]
MKQFDKKGFLALNYRTNLKKVKEEVEETLTEFLVGLIETGWQLQFDFEIDPSNLVQIHSVTLYSRILNSIQASHLLAVYGLGAESSNQCRAGLECLIQLAALNNNSALMDRIVSQHISDTLTYLNSYKNYHAKNPKISPAQTKALDDKIAELQSRKNVLKSLSIGSLGPLEGIAKEANMQSWYDLLYRRLSKTTHPSLISLQEHLKIAEDLTLDHLKNHPNFEHFTSNTYCGIKILSRAIEEVYKAVNETPPSSVVDYNKDLEALRFDELIFSDISSLMKTNS